MIQKHSAVTSGTDQFAMALEMSVLGVPQAFSSSAAELLRRYAVVRRPNINICPIHLLKHNEVPDVDSHLCTLTHTISIHVYCTVLLKPAVLWHTKTDVFNNNNYNKNCHDIQHFRTLSV